MNYAILINKVFRYSMQKALKILEEYREKIGFKDFAEQQKVLDILAHKSNTINQIKEEAYSEMLVSLAFMVNDNSIWGQEAFNSIKKYPMIMWNEAIGSMKDTEILSLLRNFGDKLPPIIIESCIVNLSDENQIKTIKKYKHKISPSDMLFENFYYSVSEAARKELKHQYPDIKDDLILELNDLSQDELVNTLINQKDRYEKIESNDLIELVLTKVRTFKLLNAFMYKYKEKIEECSDSIFELLIIRYKNLLKGTSKNYDYEEKDSFNLNLIKQFKNKFNQLGLEKTLKLFDKKAGYSINEFSINVILFFIENAYEDSDIGHYINDVTYKEIINRIVKMCSEKEYTLSDLELLVSRIKSSSKKKLIHDDYIEAIIACGKLLKNNVINKNDPLFIELRDKFNEDLFTRSTKDGTCENKVSFNGLFYRLAKGTVSFADVYTEKTLKGLIYLSKTNKKTSSSEYITTFLTDEILRKLNITTAIRWCNNLDDETSKKTSEQLRIRMALQLLCFFGPEKGKYLLNANMQGNRMENLFDGLNYKSIIIDEDGNPKVNTELINFLFGNGSVRESNTIINRMIRGELPQFEKYFVSFCNNFEEIKKSCNGILSLKRVIKYFEDVKLPIELKPDEKEFKHALKEVNSTDAKILESAVELCKDARERQYSSIPKVKGKLGDFTYEILDLDDPIAVAVGYLSHCCFVINGISYSALKHSMQSENGRTFIVYYKDNLLTQSWVWRNGDAVCFDSVEAGCAYHGMLRDDIKLVDVYKKAANEILNISTREEDEIQRIKVVTVGKSDYVFDGLTLINSDVPRPLEKDVHVYDSNVQSILAGEIPEHIRYGEVGAQYKDERKRPIVIRNIFKEDTDTVDEAVLAIESLRYRVNGTEEPLDLVEYSKLLTGKNWYILENNDGLLESGIVETDEETQKEYSSYLSRFNTSNAKQYVKKNTSNLGKKKGDK